MFSTTLGHFGNSDIYKYTLKSLDKSIGLKKFRNKSISLKVHNNQEDLFLNMAKDYAEFFMLKEYGKDKLSSNPHESQDSYAPYLINNYNVSISNTFSLLPINTKYTLWIEDDCPLFSNPNKISEYLKLGMEFLDKNNNVFSLHINGPEFPLNSNELFGLGQYGFRPHMFRTEEMFNVAQCFKYNYKNIKNIHPEMTYENIIKHLYPDSTFIQFNAKYLWHIHLGVKNFEEVIETHGLSIQ